MHLEAGSIVAVFLAGCAALLLSTTRVVEIFHEARQNFHRELFGFHEPMRFERPPAKQTGLLPEQVFLVVAGCGLITISLVGLLNL